MKRVGVIASIGVVCFCAGIFAQRPAGQSPAPKTQAPAKGAPVAAPTPIRNSSTLAQAEALWRSQDFEGAKYVFEALLKAEPKNADYRVRYADLRADRQRLQEPGACEWTGRQVVRRADAHQR